MDDKFVPIINGNLCSVKYAEPWISVLHHISSEPLECKELIDQILDKDSPLFDNLHQLELVRRITKENPQENDDKEASEKLALKEGSKFESYLEMAYAYNRIDENLKETLLNIKSDFWDFFLGIGDFACWRFFLSALKEQVVDSSKEVSKHLLKELEKREGNEKCQILAEARSLLENKNYALVEEYLNRYDHNEKDVIPGRTESLGLAEYYSEFLKGYEAIYDCCKNHKGDSFRSFANKFFKENCPYGWTSRARDNSTRLIESWPKGKNKNKPDQIKDLFACLGFNVQNATLVSANSNQNSRLPEHYQISVSPEKKNKKDYVHPIAEYGTQIKEHLDVVILYGNFRSQELVNIIYSFDLNNYSIVLVNSAIDCRERMKISEIVHDKNKGQSTILIIDWVLALFLTLQTESERLKVLLQCTLPYAVYQPFTDGSGSTADEMFSGRVAELNSIMDPKGTNIVYGGRQLGKTALLERARSLSNNEKEKRFAVYVSITDARTEEKFVRYIKEALNKIGDLKFDSKCKKIADLCNRIKQYIDDGMIEYLLLLIDESDNFFDAISEKKYEQLLPLNGLMRESGNKFKFVFAGLHNVCRAKNAKENNGIFGQFGEPLCIKPLSPSDAQQLLLKPLKYVGFQIDEKTHLETIITNTNYYPGILQFFGNKLVEKLSTDYKRNYSAVNDNPPFVLKEEQLSDILNSTDLNRSIQEKLRLTLGMDSRYYMLARCVAMCSLLKNEQEYESRMGFSTKEIMEIAGSFPIYCLENLDRIEIETLLNEMVEMGILSKPGNESVFRLRRRSFMNVIGSDLDRLEEEILENNKEPNNG